MGNRVSSGSTGKFTVEVFQTDDDGDYFLVSTGEAVYTTGGEYTGTYNVTATGNYDLHVREQQNHKSTLRSQAWEAGSSSVSGSM